MRLREIMTVSVIVLSGFSAGANQFFADEPRKDERKPEATGRFVSYNATNSTLVIVGKEGRGGITFAVAKDVKVTVNGVAGKLADLTEKQILQLYLNADRSTVLEVRGTTQSERDGAGVGVGEKPGRRDGERGDFRSQLEKYDEKAGTIVVVQRGDGGAERRATLLVAKDVKIVLEGAKDLKLADIAVNTPIAVTVNADRTTAVSIQIEPRPVRRIVFEIDGEKNTVTFRVERERITLPVAKEAKITIDNKPAKLTDLKQGNVCFATLSPDGKTVLAITHRSPDGAKDGERKKDVPKEGVGDKKRDGER